MEPDPSRREHGQALPLVIVMFVVLCGFVGLTIDVGYGLLQKRRLQSAVDLGLLSGARELPSATTAATEARSYTTQNFQLAADTGVTITTSASCMTTGCSQPDKLSLEATTQTPTFFLKLFGIDRWAVTARGAACGPCDSSIAAFDVMVVLDRSGSMSAQDMADAREGVRELLDYFDEGKDRVGLTVLESADSRAPFFTGSGTAPCETDGGSYSSTSYSPLTSGYTGYGGAAGAFMDGTSLSHDTWVVVDLAAGAEFQNANGTLNENSTLLDTLDCIQRGGSTPIGAAVQEAKNELVSRGRTQYDGQDVRKVIVYLGDGGASSTPLQRECRSRTSSNSAWGAWRACATTDAGGGSNRQWRVNAAASWYSWSAGNRDRPCADAIAQARSADSAGIDVYTIGYGVSSDWCRPGVSNSPPESPSITQQAAIRSMASEQDMYFEQPQRGDITAVFAEIGRDITAGGTRLVE